MAGETLPDVAVAAAAMAGVGQDKDSHLPASSMVSSPSALAPDGKQPTQIAQNSSNDNTDSCVVHEEITDATENEVADKVVQNSIVPEVGMTFESEKKAFDMYNTYAGQVGFSVRKSHTKRRADKSLRRKYMVCSSEGHRQTDSSKLLVECENVSSSLRRNELDADFNSRRKSPVTHIPLLKTAAESYTGRMYKEFEEEFNDQFSFSCKLLETEGSILTYAVTHMYYDYGATIIFNKEDTTITCACRKYESIGILCQHALKVFNMNDVFILPSQYILHRWTKYAKRGFYIEKPGSQEESLKTQAARISRKATSVALKCSNTKELLDELEKAIDKLDLEADNSLSNMQEQANEPPLVSSNCESDALKGTISFRIPQVVKGAKSKRGTISLEKNKGKKKKSTKKKGEHSKNAEGNSYESAAPEQFIDTNAGTIFGNSTMPQITTDAYGQSSTMAAPFIHDGYANATLPHLNMYQSSTMMGAPYIGGGYTSLLLGVDQAAALQQPVRKLHFDGVANHDNM